MSSRRMIAHTGTTKLLHILMLATIFQSGAFVVASNAQSPKERVLENSIPKHLPIKVKMRKEKEESFKDLQNNKWTQDFELEVTNTGEKPIYFLNIELISDVKLDGARLVFGLFYGRPQLGTIISKAESDDVPINPGETYVFKIHPGQIRAWEQSMNEGIHPDATRIQVLFQALSFGDGNGYWDAQGSPYPPVRKQ